MKQERFKFGENPGAKIFKTKIVDVQGRYSYERSSITDRIIKQIQNDCPNSANAAICITENLSNKDNDIFVKNIKELKEFLDNKDLEESATIIDEYSQINLNSQTKRVPSPIALNMKESSDISLLDYFEHPSNMKNIIDKGYSDKELRMGLILAIDSVINCFMMGSREEIGLLISRDSAFFVDLYSYVNTKDRHTPISNLSVYTDISANGKYADKYLQEKGVNNCCVIL